MTYIFVILGIATGLGALVGLYWLGDHLRESANERCIARYGYQPCTGWKQTLTSACLILGAIGYVIDDGKSEGTNGPLAIAFFASIFVLLLLRIGAKTDFKAACTAATGMIIMSIMYCTILSLALVVLSSLGKRDDDD